MDIKEKRFEHDIEQYLINEGGYEQFQGYSPDGNIRLVNRYYDIDKALYMDVLVEFIEKTQPKEWARYKKYYGDSAKDKLYSRLQTSISSNGLIHVLKNGIVDMGIKLKLCYFKPVSNLNQLDMERYNANILGCTRQFRYSKDNNNTIDIVLSLNGIPVVALELKDQLTGQNYENAIKQFKTDRDSKEFCFRFDNRFLVYFAVDLYEVWMTTALKDNDTYFMPFNQGSNGAGRAGGAGNPENKNGYCTSYLWEKVLQRDSLIDIIHKFISKTDDKIIFPRYHQYDVVKKLIADAKKNGSGTNYLIQHSAGSGKSNSIAWTAYRLASLQDDNNNNIFDSVIVVTNRVVLDSQLQDTINSFEHRAGLVEAIDEKKKSKSLADALNDNKRIIICTVQKFLFAYKDIDAFKGKKFAIIVDEAHQGQNGETAKVLRKALIDQEVAKKKYAEFEGIDEDEVDMTEEYINAVIAQGQHENQSFFAFTATPKGQTIELFGTYNPMTNHREPFHVYSMKQAIDEGFILDVLANYTTIKEAFKIIKVSADDPELVEGAAAKALFKYYKEHGHTIEKKTEMIMANFLQNGKYTINGKGKAMVVADSRKNAVRYYFAIKKYLNEHPQEAEGCNVLIAFSGTVTLDGKEYTEASMNIGTDGRPIKTDKKFREAFNSSAFNILVVANKYQTGFDEPLLHSMYVDKKLNDISAVQTLSRLNRTCKGKQDTFVLDFENTYDDIKNSFQPFYESTSLQGETDINKIYDLRDKIKNFNLYNFNDVNIVYDFMQKQSARKQSDSALGRLAGMFKPVVERYKELSKDDRKECRDTIRKFNGAYSFVTQLISIHDEELFREFTYTNHLLRLLPPAEKVIIDIDDKIKLEYASLKETFSGAITLDSKQGVFVPTTSKPKKTTEKKDTLQSIINRVNERFAGDFDDGDRVIVEGIYHMFMNDPEVKKFRKYAKSNSSEMFVNSLFPDKFNDIVTQCFMSNNNSFQKLFNDPDFYNKVMEAMAKELYNSLRKD